MITKPGTIKHYIRSGSSKNEENPRYISVDLLVNDDIVKNIYGYPYEFEFTGMTKGKVPPENIISIEEIKGYIQMQEKYPDYEEFYNEIK